MSRSPSQIKRLRRTSKNTTKPKTISVLSKTAKVGKSLKQKLKTLKPTTRPMSEESTSSSTHQLAPFVSRKNQEYQYIL